MLSGKEYTSAEIAGFKDEEIGATINFPCDLGHTFPF